MKFFGQTRDGVIDNLLRAYVSQASNVHQKCSDFDPDQANAYIERGLTGVSRLRYETHLSECSACRKNVVALVRLAEADRRASAVPPREAARSTWLSSAKQMFGAMSQPRWAMAAAAVIVLAISLPLLLTRNQTPDSSLATLERGTPQSSTPDTPAAVSPTAEPVSSPMAASRLHEKSDEKTQVLARGASADSKASDAPAGEAGVDLAKKNVTRTAGQPVDELQSKSEGQLAQVPAQGGAAAASQVAKNESEQSRQQQPEKDKDSGQKADETKAVRSDAESAEREKTRRAEEVAPPPAASSSSISSGDRLRRPQAKLALRDSGPAESVRLYERKVGGRKFLFKDGAWTDKDFDPNKDLPIVTIIRDSNVYKEVLAKRSGLKPFLTGFAAGDRAIIVYKGTVYKLIPQ